VRLRLPIPSWIDASLFEAQGVIALRFEDLIIHSGAAGSVD
jgi:hypothetical protein